MGVIRIYADRDGETHFEDIPSPDAAAPLTDPVAAQAAVFRYQDAGALFDWHNISVRQYYVTLTGEAEITVSDGETRRVGPGSITLVEDLTGKGHRTQIGHARPRICFSVFLDETY